VTLKYTLILNGAEVKAKTKMYLRMEYLQETMIQSNSLLEKNKQVYDLAHLVSL